LAIASMLVWILLLREVVLTRVPPTSVSQGALIAGNTPLDRRLVLGWCLGVVGVLIISAFVAVPWVRRHVRKLNGMCVVCGYDVRATGYPNQGRCPECGAPVFQRAS